MKQVTAAVIVKEGKVLIAQRAYNDTLSLKWEFPGGKIEPNEAPEDCLLREIEEELGLKITILAHLMNTTYYYSAGAIELMVYRAKVEGGDLELKVHNDAKWVTINELNRFDFAPADLPVVKRLNGQMNDD